MGQRCQPNPDDLDPNGGRAYLAPDQIEEQMRRLETGRYRLSMVSEFFGQTRQALYRRMAREDDLAIRYRQARAQGERRLADMLFEAEEPEDRESAKWTLERIHSWQKPLDRARTTEARKNAKAAEVAAAAATASPLASDVDIWREMMKSIPGRSIPQEGQ